MRRFMRLSLLLCLALFGALLVQAQVTFYTQGGTLAALGHFASYNGSGGFIAHTYDSFDVPAGERWSIEDLTFSGVLAVTESTPSASYQVIIRADSPSNIPGSIQCNYGSVATASANLTGRRYTHSLTLPTPCVVDEGTYWIAIISNGVRWNWGVANVGANNATVWRQFSISQSDLTLQFQSIRDRYQPIFALNGNLLDPATPLSINMCNATDGRGNADPERDCAPPAIIYCGIDSIVFHKLNPDGGLNHTMTVSIEAMNAVGVPTGEHAIIAQSEDGAMIFSRLTTGEFQLNTWYFDPYWENNSKPYIITWREGCLNFTNISP